MVVVVKNKEGYIEAYAEWQILDKNGQFKNNGEYIYVQDLWIHERHRGRKMLNILIKLIDAHKFAEGAKYVYWKNLKHNERVSRPFKREVAARQGV